MTAIGTDEASSGALQQGYDIATNSRSHLVSSGHITQEEFSRTCFPLFFWMLEACVEVIKQEMEETFETLHSSSDRASKTSSSAGRLPDEEVGQAAAAGMLAVLGLGLRQALQGHSSVADQDSILHRFKQELYDQCLAAHFEYVTNYIVLRLRPR